MEGKIPGNGNKLRLGVTHRRTLSIKISKIIITPSMTSISRVTPQYGVIHKTLTKGLNHNLLRYCYLSASLTSLSAKEMVA